MCREMVPAGTALLGWTQDSAHTLAPGWAGSLAKFYRALKSPRIAVFRPGNTCAGEQECFPLGAAHCSAGCSFISLPGCIFFWMLHAALPPLFLFFKQAAQFRRSTEKVNTLQVVDQTKWSASTYTHKYLIEANFT